MNKYKKEAKRRYDEARKGLTPKEIEVLNRKEEQDKKINDKIEALHLETFPEEYDEIYDSIADAEDRSRGINPMSDEYIAEVNARRKKLGVYPWDLGEVCNEAGLINSYDWCRKRVSGDK